jgi:signal transduction histidine kinase
MTRARLERLKVDGASNSIDKRYIRSDGTTLWVRAMASRVVPGPGQDAYAATVVEDIMPRKQAEEAIQKAAMLEERNRLAGEIHDTLTQSLVGIVLQLENASETLSNDAGRLYVERAKQLARTGLDHARRSIHDLRPTALESNPLPAALRGAADVLLAGSGVALDFRCDGVVRRLAPLVDEQLFYIGKEAITNAWRHGTPSTLSCRLLYGAGEVQLEVKDDGLGFDVGQASNSGRFGLANMQERARRIGARLTIESDPGHGTSVLVHLPARPAEAP